MFHVHVSRLFVITLLLILLAGCAGNDQARQPWEYDTVPRPDEVDLLPVSNEPARQPWEYDTIGRPGEVDQLAAVWPPAGEAVDASPVLQWAECPGAAEYRITVLDKSSGELAFEQVTDQTNVAVVQPLAKGRTFKWTVQAQTAGGNLLAQLSSTFFVKADMVVVRPATGAIITGRPTLSWQPYAGATTYQILVLDDDAFPPVVVYERTITTTTLSLSAPLPGGSYSWTVRALDPNEAILAELNSTFMVGE